MKREDNFQIVWLLIIFHLDFDIITGQQLRLGITNRNTNIWPQKLSALLKENFIDIWLKQL